MAIDQLAKRPDLQGNPVAQEWLRVIREGDAVHGEEIARNLCASYGVTVEQAMEQGRRYLGL